ncbi:hypothetical protein [Labilibaculum antarcticum]|uniref:Uncharacterized protein n=1 Tax=Labilibaculum antarcticum TaxID=1717717 RepID=A0A1Y1CNW0_9BACT|nr:hypothetical protein [Labilibaculum antarcticum]BAX82096.1 hypothetical protein ALGA_3804 [Labilibaculum antarcticum]
MFYDIIDKLDFSESDKYAWEEIDGKPRYRWYKYALNSVYMISSIDDLRDIDNISFDDLGAYYDSVAWVAKNDPDALKHIMGTLVEPVTDIVKQKLLSHLLKRKYYESCAIVEKYLISFPVPPERTFTRKKEKFTKDVNENIAKQIYHLSNLLVTLKTTGKEKLYEPEMTDSLSKLLNFESFSDYLIREHLDSLEWLRQNALDELKEMFTVEICTETKDNLLTYLAQKELYSLCQFFKETLQVLEMPFYFEIPPYHKKITNDDGDYINEDEE